MPPAAHRSYSLFTLHYSLATTCDGISSLATPESWGSRQEIFSPPHFCASGKMSAQPKPRIEKDSKAIRPAVCMGGEYLNLCRLRHTASVHSSLFTCSVPRQGRREPWHTISLPGCVRQGKASAQPAARELLPARAPENPGTISLPGYVRQSKALAQPKCANCSPLGPQRTPAQYHCPAVCARVRHPHSLRRASCSPPGVRFCSSRLRSGVPGRH